jgi:hypothetical protein
MATVTPKPSAKPTSMPLAAANYFVTVNQLSARNAPQTSEELAQTKTVVSTSSLAPYMPFASLALFILLFVAAFGIQVTNGVRNARHVITAFTIALFAASIPLILSYIQLGTGQTVRAGPEEIPRNVRVIQLSKNSSRISWNTDAPRIGVVRIGEVPMTEINSRIVVANERQSVQEHIVDVPGLMDGHRYEFEILSGHTWYDNNGRFIQFLFRSHPPGK